VDFVVVGFGVGALGVVLGLLARDIGPWFRRVPSGRALPGAELARRVAWGRRCRAGGAVVAIAGGAVCAATIVALLAGVGDGAGLAAVLLTLVGALLAVAGWAAAGAERWRELATPRPTRLAPPDGGAAAVPNDVPPTSAWLWRALGEDDAATDPAPGLAQPPHGAASNSGAADGDRDPPDAGVATDQGRDRADAEARPIAAGATRGT